jgi:hypothetical protein
LTPSPPRLQASSEIIMNNCRQKGKVPDVSPNQLLYLFGLFVSEAVRGLKMSERHSVNPTHCRQPTYARTSKFNQVQSYSTPSTGLTIHYPYLIIEHGNMTDYNKAFDSNLLLERIPLPSSLKSKLAISSPLGINFITSNPFVFLHYVTSPIQRS